MAVGKNGQHSNGNGNGKGRGKPLAQKPQHASPKAIDDEMLRVMALQLRRDGASYRTIAQVMNAELKKQFENGQLSELRTIQKDTAHRLVLEALNEVKTANAESAEQVKLLEVERLDIWLQRLSSSKNANTPRTIDTMLRIQERRARLLGLDAPKKQLLGGIDGNPIELELTDARSVVRNRLKGLQESLGHVVPPASTNGNGKHAKSA